MMTVVLATILFLTPAEYPRAQLLIEPAALAQQLIDPVILDARDEADFLRAHIPGALRVDPKTWDQSFEQGTDDTGWAKRIGELGITAETRVVVYDDARSLHAARTWWILRYWGVKNVQLLNGGWRAWTAGHHPVSTTVNPPRAVMFVPDPQPTRFATLKDVQQSLDPKSLQLVDARTEGEHCGVDPFKNKKAGAIPGAKHLHWQDLVDADTHRFLDADAMADKFRAAGIALTEPTATYCQGGGRSSVMAFALELMGADQVRNYYGSWGEWGNTEGTPVEVKRK